MFLSTLFSTQLNSVTTKEHSRIKTTSFLLGLGRVQPSASNTTGCAAHSRRGQTGFRVPVRLPEGGRRRDRGVTSGREKFAELPHRPIPAASPQLSGADRSIQTPSDLPSRFPPRGLFTHARCVPAKPPEGQKATPGARARSPTAPLRQPWGRGTAAGAEPTLAGLRNPILGSSGTRRG